MFRDFIRMVRMREASLTEEKQQAISDTLNKELGEALNKAMRAGMPASIAARYLEDLTAPLRKVPGMDGGTFTILGDDGRVVVDGGHSVPVKH